MTFGLFAELLDPWLRKIKDLEERVTTLESRGERPREFRGLIGSAKDLSRWTDSSKPTKVFCAEFTLCTIGPYPDADNPSNLQGKKVRVIFED